MKMLTMTNLCTECLITPTMLVFFFTDSAPTELYTLSLHDALPILWKVASMVVRPAASTMARHFVRKLSPSRRRCGSQRQPVRSPMRWSPFIFFLPPKCEGAACRSEEHTSELQSQSNLVCRLLLEKK